MVVNLSSGSSDLLKIFKAFFLVTKFIQLLCWRVDAQKLEEWAKTQSPSSLVEFASRDGEIEDILKDIAERAGSKGNFSYSRFFAVGLFRLLELANATEPTILDKVVLHCFGFNPLH